MTIKVRTPPMTLDASTGASVYRLASAGLLLCLVAGCAEHRPAASEPVPEPPSIQGSWRAKGEADGSTMTIEGDSLYFYDRPDFQYDTTFTLVPDTDPPQLRATILDSPRTTDSEGDVVDVIYKFQDGTLTMAVFDEAGDGPPNFVDVVSLNEFERVPPGE